MKHLAFPLTAPRSCGSCGRILATLFALLLAAAGCVDDSVPTGAAAGGEVDLFLAPSLPVGSQAAQGDAQSIGVIRLRALQSGSGTVLSEREFQVDPDPQSGRWRVSFTVPIPETGQPRVVVTIELLTAAGSVEWSGITGEVQLNGVAPPTATRVEVIRGPLDNLSVQGVEIGEPEPVVVNNVTPLAASVSVSDPSARPRLFWESLSPDRVAVDPETGVATGRRPGQARIRVVAGNFSDEIQVEVMPGTSDLVLVAATDSPELVPGQAASFSLTASNRGPDYAENAVVEFSIPEGFAIDQGSLESGTVTPGQDGSLLWTLVRLNADETTSLVARGTAPEDLEDGAVLSVSAIIETGEGQEDPNTSDNETGAEARVPWPRADLSVTAMASAAQVIPGAELSWTITVANAGPAAATDIDVVSTLPNGFVPDDASQARIRIPAMAPGASETFTIAGRVAAGRLPGSTLRTTVRLDMLGRQVDPNTADNAAVAEVSVPRLRTDLAVSVAATPERLQVGESATWTITVENRGPDASPGLEVLSTLPPLLEVVSATPSAGTLVGGSATRWTLTSLAVGETAELVVSGSVRSDASDGARLTVESQVVPTGEAADDPDPGNNTASATVAVAELGADLALILSGGAQTVAPGGQVVFTVELRNLGPLSAPGSRVDLTLTPGLTIVSAEASRGSVAGATWTIDALDNQAEASLQLTVGVPSTAPGGFAYSISAEASVGDGRVDPVLGNNVGSASLRVEQVIVLGLSPATSERLVGGTQQFSVIEGPAGPYTWSVNGTDGGGTTFGTVDSNGFYRAPSQVPTPATFPVCARVQSTPSITGCAQVTVVAIPSEGADLVVVNDVNPFDNTRMANPDNQQFVRNLVGFTEGGSRATGSVVWVDGGRDSRWLTAGSSQISTFSSTVAGLGLTVEDISSDNTVESPLRDIPSTVKAIFLFVPTIAYTHDEVNSLKAFAAQGGRIIFIGEHDGFYGNWIPLENEFLQLMGAQMTNVGDQLDCGSITLPPSSLSAHPIMAGMNSFTVGCGSRIILGPNDFALYFDSSGEFVLAAVGKIDTTPLPPTGETFRMPYPKASTADPSVTTHGGELVGGTGGN